MSDHPRERTRSPRGGSASSRRRRRTGGGEASGRAPGQDGAGNGGKPTGKKGGDGNPKRNRRNNRKRSQARRGKNRRPDVLHDAPRFWGDSDRLPEVSQDVRITDDPSAVPRSLGPPPLPGHEVIAEQYFGVVYDRAVSTAGLLAAAGGLIDPDDLVEHDS